MQPSPRGEDDGPPPSPRGERNQFAGNAISSIVGKGGLRSPRGDRSPMPSPRGNADGSRSPRPSPRLMSTENREKSKREMRTEYAEDDRAKALGQSKADKSKMLQVPGRH